MKIILITAKAQCVDADTEFFNGYEWKRISEYSEGEYVLQYNKDGTAELIIPSDYIINDEEFLYEMNTQKLSMCLSEDHNCPYITNKNNLFQNTFRNIMDRELNNIYGFDGRFITSFNYVGGKGIDLSDEEIELMCAIICDSSFVGKSDTCFFNLKKDRKKEELRNLLNRMNIKYREKEYPSMPDYIRFYVKAPRVEKEFSKYWYNCNKKQLELICKNIIKWDGSVRDLDSFTFSTNSKNTSEFIQFAFSSCGYKAQIRIDDRVGQEYITSGKTYIRKSKTYEVSISKNNLISIHNHHKDNSNMFKKYKTIDGKSYCFTVPSHMLVLRRNNKIFITGNCGKDTTANIMKQQLESIGKKVLICHYADLLKYICRTFFDWDGVKDDKGRTILQYVGTDNIRKKQEDYWVKFIADFLDMFYDEWDYVLIPDTRFPNEIDYMENEFGNKVYTIRVERPNFISPLTKEQQNHPSETALDNYNIDIVISNSGTLEDLELKVKHYIEMVLKEGEIL